MKKQETPFDRCIITCFLRDVFDNTPREPVKLTWLDYAGPIGLFCFLLAVFLVVHFFPNGIWSL